MLQRVQQARLSYHSFRHAKDLSRLISDDLALLLSDRFDAGAQPVPEPERETPPRPKVDVPGVASRFIGRERELAALNAMLGDSQTRLLTLVGPGGVGKTRLAMQSLAAIGPQYEEVAVAQLDRVAPPPPLATAIASAMGIPEGTSAPLADSIAGSIGTRRVLLMLDGFERSIDFAPLVAELLGRTSRLTILVTSRE